LLAKDGLVSVLKQMPVSLVTAIEVNCVPGQKPAHHGGHRYLTGFQ